MGFLFFRSEAGFVQYIVANPVIFVLEEFWMAEVFDVVVCCIQNLVYLKIKNMSLFLGLILTGTNKKIKNLVLDIANSIECFANLVTICKEVDKFLTDGEGIVISC